MNKAYLVFDYFKEAFHLNRNNKILYKPQILLIMLKSLIILGSGYLLYNWILSENVLDALRYSNFDIENLSFNLFTIVSSALLTLVLFIIASRVVEAGLYNMYKKSIIENTTDLNDFWDGVQRYFFKFIIGDILISLFWIFAFVPFIFMGIISLTIGFTIIPIFVSIVLTMWKVSVVMNDCSVMRGFDDSINFARKNFFPLLVLQIIHWSFLGVTGGSNYGRIGDLFDTDKNPSMNNLYQNKQEFIDNVIKFIKIGIVVIIPVVTVAYAFSALIGMIIEVFFSLALFVAYKNKFETSTEVLNGEVLE